MAIGIGSSGLRLSTDFTSPDNGKLLPGVAENALTAQGPVAVSTSGRQSTGAKSVQVVPANGGTAAVARAYYGFSFQPSAAAGKAVSIARGVLVEGFTGVEPGKAVYVSLNNTGTDPAGLTQTQPTTSVTETGDSDAGAVAVPTGWRVGVGVGTTGIYFD
jgi:hypothetical protein